MSLDITKQINDWPYEPGQINVRLISGDDGRPKIQMRVDLGILQMETEGRPDGVRPEGYESLLEMHEDRLDAHVGEHGSDDDFSLDQEACRHLRDEAVQYYHRYISLLVLEDYEGVVRDTSRNLRLLDFCGTYAESDQDRAMLEQFRPYLTMMRARALAGQALEAGEAKAAMAALDDGLEQIRVHFDETGHAEEFESASEAALLREMRDSLAPKLPISAREELRKRLERAIMQENYELAAILRDELKMTQE
ncbi:MAG: UvrB/UvrC motif-containing protein [Phycisphaerales bacterium]|nr:UvrB/UvrC motif-containing protein [Phycisphaerales bacterium]